MGTSTINFNQFEIGTTIEVVTQEGYYVSELCGTVEQHLADGHAIIRNWNNLHFSTVGFENRAAEAFDVSSND